MSKQVGNPTNAYTVPSVSITTARTGVSSKANVLAAPWVCAEGADTHEVTFSLYAPQARTVDVIGDFNQWQSVQ